MPFMSCQSFLILSVSLELLNKTLSLNWVGGQENYLWKVNTESFLVFCFTFRFTGLFCLIPGTSHSSESLASIVFEQYQSCHSQDTESKDSKLNTSKWGAVGGPKRLVARLKICRFLRNSNISHTDSIRESSNISHSVCMCSQLHLIVPV